MAVFLVSIEEMKKYNKQKSITIRIAFKEKAVNSRLLIGIFIKASNEGYKGKKAYLWGSLSDKLSNLEFKFNLG